MSEATAILGATPEAEKLSLSERMSKRIIEVIKNQTPAAHAERYEKTFNSWVDKLGDKRPELAEKLRPHLESAAKVAGVTTTVAEVALFAAALYGGYAFLQNPAAAVASLKAGFATLSAGAEKAFVAGKGAALGAAAGAGKAFEAGKEAVINLADKVKLIWDKILHPINPNIYPKAMDI